jgi:hypothetical protein
MILLPLPPELLETQACTWLVFEIESHLLFPGPTWNHDLPVSASQVAEIKGVSTAWNLFFTSWMAPPYQEPHLCPREAAHQHGLTWMEWLVDNPPPPLCHSWDALGNSETFTSHRAEFQFFATFFFLFPFPTFLWISLHLLNKSTILKTLFLGLLFLEPKPRLCVYESVCV